ncbi:MAG TPA: enoyl-CoA hydratase/isomerase family protein, partial [Solirubrobacteraceae bacterium]
MSIVTTEDAGPVRHVVLNRPEKRNAMNGELVLGVGAALREAAAEPGVLCVVIRGEGPMFSSGMDFSALGELADAPAHLRAFRRECTDAWNLAEEMTKPVICQIHGGCIGGAMELALACDMRVMADDAVMGLPETRVGLVPDVGGCSRLPAVVGLGRAKELIMTGKIVGAEEA